MNGHRLCRFLVGPLSNIRKNLHQLLLWVMYRGWAAPSCPPHWALRSCLTSQFREFLEAWLLMTSLCIKLWEAPEFSSCFSPKHLNLRFYFQYWVRKFILALEFLTSCQDLRSLWRSRKLAARTWKKTVCPLLGDGPGLKALLSTTRVHRPF